MHFGSKNCCRGRRKGGRSRSRLGCPRSAKFFVPGTYGTKCVLEGLGLRSTCFLRSTFYLYDLHVLGLRSTYTLEIAETSILAKKHVDVKNSPPDTPQREILWNFGGFGG